MVALGLQFDRFLLVAVFGTVLVRGPGARDRPAIHIGAAHAWLLAATGFTIASAATAAIQAAIDTVSARQPDRWGFRGAVLLAPGTFNVSATLHITTSGVVLAGSGSGIQDLAKTFINLSFFLARLQFRAVQHAQAGAVVTAVFEPAQSLEQDGGRLLFADVAYNAAHKSSGTRLARTRPP